MKVSRNDASLAHAAAKHEIKKAVDRLHSGLGMRLLESNSVKQFAKNLELTFGGRVIDASLGRVIGSRASAGVVVADTDTSENLALTQLIFNARYPAGHRVSAHAIPIIVQRHALARLMQRVVGESSLNKLLATIQPHLYAGLKWAIANNPLEPRIELAISGRGVELAGSVDEHGCLRLKTAIDAGTMESPLRQAWAMGDKIEVRETFNPLTKKAAADTI